MDIPATLDTAKFRQLVLQGIGSLSGGGSGATSTNTAVGPDGVTRVPLQVNSDGELKVNVEASINADLTLIEGKLDTIIGIETPQSADVAAIKTSLNNGISVNKDASGSGSVTTATPLVITTTNYSTLAFQSNAVATGTVTIEASVDDTNYTATTYAALTTGNTSSSFNAATATIGQIDTSGFRNIRFRSNTIVGTVGITYNLSANVSTVMLDNPLPTGSNVIGAVTANAGTNLNTSALALESGGNLATVATKMSDGLQTTKIVNGANTLAVDSAGAINANLGPSTSYPYSAVIPSTSTTIIGPVTCSNFRVAAVHIVALGTAVTLTAQISNDGTNWLSAQTQRIDSPGAFGQSAGTFTTLGAGQFHQVYLYGALYFRIIGTSTSGTTTLSVNMSQTVLQVPNQAVNSVSSLAVSPQTNTTTTASGFYNYHSLSCAATTNATVVKGATAQLGILSLTNNSATWAYFHLVNKSSAPTVGTDAGVLNIGVAPNSTLDCGTSFCGIRMPFGLAYYVSTGPSSLDTGALLAANTFVVNLSYV